MVTWAEDGRTGGMIRIVDDIGARPSIATWSSNSIYLASPGAVDVQAIERFQYNVTDFTLIYAQAKVNIEAADVAANPGRTFTVTYFAAPASAVPASPTIAQIIAAATKIERAHQAPDGISSYFRTTAGQVYCGMFPLASSAWTPNQKWWLAVVPVHVASMATTPSAANDLPIGSSSANGRAISFWTNRTPKAPVILAPGARTTAFAGTEVTLTINPNDPDEIATFPGDTRKWDFDDVAGVQIQYAPVATSDNPTPAWADLPITKNDNSGVGRGWYIARSATAPANDGAKQFWETYSIKIRCGSTSTTANSGNLPSGNWQIRVRTFDYGHPFPSTVYPDVYPLTQSAGLYTPETYPPVNTSPWSTPVVISVSEQVPSPIPISPRDSIAVAYGTPIRLTWQYRNTYVPPFAQAIRSVQIRPVGGEQTTFDGFSALHYLDLDAVGYVVEPGVKYEWRVEVTDTNGVTSAYSDWVGFWVVSAPQSGEVKPVPSSTIEGATLGCGTDIIEIFRRGGRERVGVLSGVSYSDWNRVRDDISTSRVVVSSWDVDCGNLLAQLQPWAYEVVITRKNGFSKDRVWEGPITLLTYESDRVVIEAKDVMAYAYRRIIKQAMVDTANGSPITTRASQVLSNAFAPDDPNVLAYLNVIAHPDDPMQYRSLPAYSKTAFEEVDDMAANAGLDYTVIGRSIILWGTKNRIGLLPEFRDKDLGHAPIVSVYGMSMANRYVVSDGNGVWGEATRLDVSGNDETYGLVEMLSSTWASDADDETGTYTQEGTEKVIASFEKSAEHSIADRYPPPVVVRIPDNTTLNPDTVLSIQQLVPGVAIPLRSTGTLRSVVAMQKLDEIKSVHENGTETITITLSPFAAQDVEEGEDG